MQKTTEVGSDTLISLFIAGLHDSIKQELLTNRPPSLDAAFALAQRLAACQSLPSAMAASPRPSWHNRDNRPKTTPALVVTNPPKTATTPQPRPEQNTGPIGGFNNKLRPNYPVIRVSAAERAEKTRRGECWWCPEQYSREHVCSKKFYALMGADDEDDWIDDENGIPEDDGETMVITGDVSSIHVISPKIRPRTIRLKGRINDSAVSVLIDGGSTHNFIQPAVAEQLSLPLHEIKPFRVFVGNGESLRCSHACLHTPITMQGYTFEIDLFILQVKGPDVILGVQWLQELGDVTKNYRHLTMKFDVGNKPIFLQGERTEPRPISYNILFSLVGQEYDCELFELVSVSPELTTAEPSYPPPLTDPGVS
ncbi:hypothetical protein SASPL_108889 [Salvia splendens]|uniref:Uncharacterized protein n=1 Tax=Salvia splendens TaxID=180675 RepID=A0A8X8YJ24_SALSN|nr:hypothetical protein SASPL_108889 [Salvia splendens]